VPRFTIDITDKALAKLQTHVDRTNENQGTALTVQQWLVLHVNEIAIAQDLGAAVDGIRQQEETNARSALEAAVKTARDQLLAALEA